MIIKVTNDMIKAMEDKSVYHVSVEGNGCEIAEALEALLTDLLENGMPECLLDVIVVNAKKKAREVYRDTDSIKVKLSDDEHDKCMELIDDILEILDRLERRAMRNDS